MNEPHPYENAPLHYHSALQARLPEVAEQIKKRPIVEIPEWLAFEEGWAAHHRAVMRLLHEVPVKDLLRHIESLQIPCPMAGGPTHE